MHEQFTIDEAGEITLAPFMYRERQRETARRAGAEAEARRSSGVRFGGMEPDAFRGRSEAEIRADAQKAYSQTRAFTASPRGRFLACLGELTAISYRAEAETARSAMCRGFMSPDQPANAGEVGIALLALNGIAGDVARTARECLAELLIEAHRMAA